MKRNRRYRKGGRSGTLAVLVWGIVALLGSPLHAGEAEERIVEGNLTDFGEGFVSVDHKRYTVCSDVEYLDALGDPIEMHDLADARRVAISVRPARTVSAESPCVSRVQIMPIILN